MSRGTTTLQNYLVLFLLVSVCVLIVMIVVDQSLSGVAEKAVNELLLE